MTGGRPVTGTKRQRGSSWQIIFDAQQFKASESFKDEAVADAWRTAVTTALAEGRTPRSGEQWRRSASRTSLTPRTLSDEQRQRTPIAVVFESLCRTRYVDRQQAGAERLLTVRSHWSNHLLPFVERQIGTEPCIQDVIFEVAHAFPLWLAGRHTGTEVVGGAAAADPDLWLAGGQELTGAQAAAQAGISTSQLNARRRAGELVATQQRTAPGATPIRACATPAYWDTSSGALASARATRGRS